jgi:hypothetical protein
MKDTYYKQLCKCNNPECDHEQSFYVWSSMVDNFSCDCVLCEGGKILPYERPVVEAPALLGLHNERNLAQRKVRNHQHFKKEVLPTITDSVAKKHFSKKLNITL